MNTKSTTRRRLLVGGVAATAATALTVSGVAAFADDQDAAPDQAAETYAATELPVPDGFDESRVTSMDPTGAYLVGSASNDDESVMLLWQNGEVEVVELPDGASASTSVVSSAGEIVGNLHSDDGSRQVFRVQDGEFTVVEDSEQVIVSDVNADGDFVGKLETDDPEQWPYVWRDGADAPEQLEVPAGSRSGTAVSIADDGTIAGYTQAGTGSSGFPLVWDAAGEATELEPPDDVTSGILRVDAMAGDWLLAHIGESQTDRGTLRWNLEDGVGERLSEHNVDSDVNVHGWAVGHTESGRNPAMFVDGELIELPGLSEQADARGTAVTIDDDGFVFGNLLDEDDLHTAVAWEPAE